MTKTALILGASGKIGHHSAIAFRSAGWTVRVYDRSKDDMTEAARGVDVIVNGLNPPAYHNWAKLIPKITAQVIAAAKASGATVIVPGNVYNFAAVPGTISENSSQRPKTRKGRIRVEMEQSYRQSGVRTIILRAGNFIDPFGNDDVMTTVFLRNIAKGKLSSPGRADAMQAFCYLPDWARAAVMLAEKRESLAAFEDVPFPGHSFTANLLREQLANTLDRKIEITGFPWWLMTLASPFWELAREISEMRYLWNLDHRLDDTKFNRLLPDFSATDLESVMIAGLPANIRPDKSVPRQQRIASI